MAQSEFYIFTVVFGDKYLEWMKQSLVKSLCYPKNKEAVKNARWVIYSLPQHMQDIYNMCTKVMPFHQIEMHDVLFEDMGHIAHLKCMQRVMLRCLLDKVPMLTAPPDTVFGEGTIDMMKEYGTQKDTCVAIPHPRVNDSILYHLPSDPVENAELVKLFLEHQHKAFSLSNKKLPVNAIYRGGISWEQLEDKLYAVQHFLPTVYWSNFNEEDRKFFSRTFMGRPIQYGEWDWGWPSELMRSERLRTIGSSDLAWVMEVTDHWKNVPALTLADQANPDAFFRGDYHMQVNRQYIHVWRSA